MAELESDLVGEVHKEFEPAGLSEDLVDIDLLVQMCYPGQNFDMGIPLPEGCDFDQADLAKLGDLFHTRHEAERGFCFRDQEPLVRGMRVVARGRTSKPEHFATLEPHGRVADALIGRRTAHFGTGPLDVPVYEGFVLGVGAEIDGPALVQEPFTVVVLPPDSVGRLDEHGNYTIQL